MSYTIQSTISKLTQRRSSKIFTVPPPWNFMRSIVSMKLINWYNICIPLLFPENTRNKNCQTWPLACLMIWTLNDWCGVQSGRLVLTLLRTLANITLLNDTSVTTSCFWSRDGSISLHPAKSLWTCWHFPLVKTWSGVETDEIAEPNILPVSSVVATQAACGSVSSDPSWVCPCCPT